MRDRVKQSDLEALVYTINKLTGSPTEYSTEQSDGTHKTNVGHYCLSYAYGGVNLHRVVSDGGGVTTPLGGGYHTKRELYYRLQSFINGLTAR